MPTIFENRKDAGQQLAKKLSAYRNTDTIVLGMPRGGVIVAAEVARVLNLPMDVVISRKLGAPGQPEFAIGAIACHDVVVFNEEILSHFKLDESALQNMIKEEKKEMERRMQLYSGKNKLPQVEGRTVIIVDDGIATGLTALATVRSVRKMNPKRIILAVGVCAADSAKKLKEEVDEVICVESPTYFHAVGSWYRDFGQTTDKEVIEALKLKTHKDFEG